MSKQPNKSASQIMQTILRKKFDEMGFGNKINIADGLRINWKFENGEVVDCTVTIKYPKAQMVSIYARYSKYYEQKRGEYIRNHNTQYGSEKFAIEETAKQIEEKEHIKVNIVNLKQAMTRVFIRRPIKVRTTD